jgi:hypothetical protein
MTKPVIPNILNASLTNTNTFLGFFSGVVEVSVLLACDTHTHNLISIKV